MGQVSTLLLAVFENNLSDSLKKNVLHDKAKENEFARTV